MRGMDPAFIIFDVEEVDEGGADVELCSDCIDD